MTTATKTATKNAPTARLAERRTTIAVLTNIDTGESRYFSSVAAAEGVGDVILGEPKNARPWTYYPRNFSKTSATGWQKNNGRVYLQITVATIEG